MNRSKYTVSKFFFLIVLSLSIYPAASGQDNNFLYFYRVYFRDKGNNTGSYSESDLLSPRAIQRREKMGINVPDFRDLPVEKQYIREIENLGFTFHSSSKWMNTALFKTRESADIGIIQALPYVAEVKRVKVPGLKSIYKDKLEIKTTEAGQYSYDRPVSMLNGGALHNAGFMGEDVLIAVLDGGFTNANRIESLEGLRARNGILATYDFVNKTDYVYNASDHGTAVMSILAGDQPGLLAGTAPGADYILLKTEDVESEFPCEEDFWAAGAEFADSSGADIISSSLGYFLFDDPSMNYKHSDLDGHTAFITKAADIAASKGMLVVVSAGNERGNIWGKIIFPSDGDSVISVGAVDENKVIASFSSPGPSADGRIKPDMCAMGVRVPIQVAPGAVTTGNGTSLSCPVISGMSACLLQAVPSATNREVIDALHLSGDKYNNPDTLYGYGIPDMASALNKLRQKYMILPDDEMTIAPNPVTRNFALIFQQPPGKIEVEIFTSEGRLVSRKDYPDLNDRIVNIDLLQNSDQGVYFLKVKKEEGQIVKKIIKLNE
jgi:hypothetical protein